jgi:uncharacterized protein YndB with AHSA1/START domain
MEKPKFVYVTYIRTTPAKLWEALTDPKFIRQYFCGTRQESEWTPGASWKMIAADGVVTDAGEVLEVEPQRKLVLKWRNELRPELREEGYSQMTYELESRGDTVKLTVIHQIDRTPSKLLEAVSGGWPLILANLKSLLETGKTFEISEWKTCSAK